MNQFQRTAGGIAVRLLIEKIIQARNLNGVSFNSNELEYNFFKSEQHSSL